MATLKDLDKFVGEMLASKDGGANAFGRLVATDIPVITEAWMRDELKRDPKGVSPALAMLNWCANVLTSALTPMDQAAREELARKFGERLGQKMLNMWPRVAEARAKEDAARGKDRSVG